MKALEKITKCVVAFFERSVNTHQKMVDGARGLAMLENGMRINISGQYGPVIIEAGSSDPVFTTVFCKGKLAEPLSTDKLVIQVVDLGHRLETKFWGYARQYDECVARISARSTYRVCQTVSLLGKFDGRATTQDPIIFIGCMEAAQEESPRDGLRESRRDNFAPVYITGPVTGYNYWQCKAQSGQWVDCEDPRPFPKGVNYRLVHRKDGNDVYLATGTAEKINWRFPRGEKDPLKQYELSDEQVGEILLKRFHGLPVEPHDLDGIVWLREDVGHKGVQVLVECADPRPHPLPKQEVKSVVVSNTPTVLKSKGVKVFHGMDAFMDFDPKSVQLVEA